MGGKKAGKHSLLISETDHKQNQDGLQTLPRLKKKLPNKKIYRMVCKTGCCFGPKTELHVEL